MVIYQRWGTIITHMVTQAHDMLIINVLMHTKKDFSDVVFFAATSKKRT